MPIIYHEYPLGLANDCGNSFDSPRLDSRRGRIGVDISLATDLVYQTLLRRSLATFILTESYVEHVVTIVYVTLLTAFVLPRRDHASVLAVGAASLLAAHIKR